MIARILGTGVGVFLILFVLLSRGLPVLIFIKMLPLLLILIVALAFIYAGITSDWFVPLLTLTMETVTITKKEYESLIEDQNWLNTLKNAGVDNWQGIDYAYEMLREQESENSWF